jgi:hypothetical protein
MGPQAYTRTHPQPAVSASALHTIPLRTDWVTLPKGSWQNEYWNLYILPNVIFAHSLPDLEIKHMIWAVQAQENMATMILRLPAHRSNRFPYQVAPAPRRTLISHLLTDPKPMAYTGTLHPPSISGDSKPEALSLAEASIL